VVIGEQNPSSQGGRRKPLQGVRIGVVVQLQLPSLPPDFHQQDLLDVLAEPFPLAPGSWLRFSFHCSSDKARRRFRSTCAMPRSCPLTMRKEQSDAERQLAVSIQQEEEQNMYS